MNGRYFIFAVILLAVQILINNYLNLSQYLLISILPTLVITMPVRIKTFWVLVITFIAGFLVDFLAGGMIGLTLLALLPVAASRNALYHIIFGSGAIDRQEDLSIKRQGAFKVSIAIILSLLLFFAIYISVDAAGTRSFWFILLKLTASTIASYIVSIFALRLLTS